MTLHIELPVAVETALLAQAAAEGKDISTFVIEAVTERLAAHEAAVTAPPSMRPASDFAERLQVWVDLHPRNSQAVDDRREAIYADR